MKQRGFSFLVILAAILLLGTVSGAGYYVWSQNGGDEQEQNTAQNQSTDESEISSSGSVIQLNETLTSETLGFSLDYTKYNECTGSFSASNEINITYKQGHRGYSFVACPTEIKSYAKPFNLIVNLNDSMFDENMITSQATKMEKKTDYVLSSESDYSLNGVDGTEWVYESIEGGPQIYRYYFQNDTLTYSITINEDGLEHNDYDYTELGRNIFNTFTFL
jgi:hypothetical protein